MKRKHLEIYLSSLKPNPNPKLEFEEYNLDPVSASTVLYIAMSLGDISTKRVIDLGCGTGVLSIGAAISGARHVVGIDIDKDSIRAAVVNAKSLHVRVDFVSGAIDCIRGPFDTTIMNPPFGSRKRGMDVKFLEKSLGISKVTYSIHKSSDTSDAFLRKRIKELGGEVKRLGKVRITLPRLFDFHQKTRYNVNAILYRIVVKAV